MNARVTPVASLQNDPAYDAACDARDAQLELAADARYRDAYSVRAIAKRIGKGHTTVQRWFDPASGRSFSEAHVARIGPEFAARYYRRRLARLASIDAPPADDPRLLTASIVRHLGKAAEEADNAMRDLHCSPAEWRAVASCCGALAGQAARAEASALASAARAGERR